MSSSTTTADLYSELPPIKGQRLKFTSDAPFTPTFVAHQLAPARLDAASYYENRVKGRTIMLDDSARAARAKALRDARATRQAKDAERRKAHTIGARQADVKRLWTLDPADARFAVFMPIHYLWLGYMAELLGLPSRPAPGSVAAKAPRMPPAGDMQAKLVKADFHGCIVTVHKAKNPCLVGRSGIVVHETENTFKIVTRKDTLKVLPKRNSIFTFRIPLYGPPPLDPDGNPVGANHEPEPEIEFELYGSQFCYRSSDRASRKFKHKETIELL